MSNLNPMQVTVVLHLAFSIGLGILLSALFLFLNADYREIKADEFRSAFEPKSTKLMVRQAIIEQSVQS